MLGAKVYKESNMIVSIFIRLRLNSLERTGDLWKQSGDFRSKSGSNVPLGQQGAINIKKLII